MARLFDDGSSEYLELDQAPVSAAAFTMACWFNSDDIANNQTLMYVGDKDVDNSRWDLRLQGGAGGDPVRISCEDAGGTTNTDTSSGYSANTWHHACTVIAAADDRRIYIDGGSKNTTATSRTPANADRVAIGRNGQATPGTYMSGAIAEAAIWSIALSDAEVALLAKGFSPLFIRPEALVAYWPLIRDADTDWIGDFNLTAFNTPTVTTHPPQIVHPTVPIAPTEALAVISPSTIFGLGLVNNILILNPIFGLGTVFSPTISGQIFTTPNQRPEIATPGLADYKVRVKNQDGEVVAEFDNWLSLSFTHKVNNRGTCRFEINGEDRRIEFLTPDSSNLDNQIEVWRRNPIVGLDWYTEWEGFLRTNNDLFEQNDNNKLPAFGFSYLDLARRAEIKWVAGSTQADKSGVGETVQKSYVSENIGVAALLADGRGADNTMPGLSIQADIGAGLSWAGAMADKELLDTLQKIALASGVDFDIIGTGAATFQFVTYNGAKTDRTKENADGNSPVIFALGFGNMIVPVLSKNRSTEVTAAYALGKGTDDARQSVLVETLARLDSPWNRIEKTTSASNTAGDDLTSAADELLEKNVFDTKFTFQVLQTLSTYYGFHYTWGDLVTAQFKEDAFDKKITDVQVNVSPNSKGEQISIKFADN